MKSGRIYFALLVLSCCNCICAAQQRSGYLDPSLPPEERARDLVQLMTLDEKVSQLVNQARAIPASRCPLTTGGAKHCMAS